MNFLKADNSPNGGGTVSLKYLRPVLLNITFRERSRVAGPVAGPQSFAGLAKKEQSIRRKQKSSIHKK
jgi:hypothetical protein